MLNELRESDADLQLEGVSGNVNVNGDNLTRKTLTTFVGNAGQKSRKRSSGRRVWRKLFDLAILASIAGHVVPTRKTSIGLNLKMTLR